MSPEEGTRHPPGGLHAVSEYARSWEQAVERAEPVRPWPYSRTAGTSPHVVPSGEIERLRQTIDVLSDNDLLHELRSGVDDLRAGRVVLAADVADDLRRRSAQR